MSEEEAALLPLEQKEINFYGDNIPAALVSKDSDQKQVYVPLRPLCEYLGLDWSSQLKRLKRDEVLREGQGVVIMTTPGGQQEMICLALDLLPGWLFGISTNKVKAEHKEKIRRYRLECFKVLWQAFQSDVIAAGFGEGEGQELFGTGAGISYSTSVAPNPPSAVLIQIRETALAVAQLAEQQLALEQQVDEAGRLAALAHTRLDNAAQVFKEFRERLGEIEKKVAPPTFISDEQAAQIGLAVKALAEQLTKKDTSKNYYQAVYQELYRRFGVSSYKRVRTGQFEAVMKFLEDWRVSGKNTAS